MSMKKQPGHGLVAFPHQGLKRVSTTLCLQSRSVMDLSKKNLSGPPYVVLTPETNAPSRYVFLAQTSDSAVQSRPSLRRHIRRPPKLPYD